MPHDDGVASKEGPYTLVPAETNMIFIENGETVDFATCLHGYDYIVYVWLEPGIIEYRFWHRRPRKRRATCCNVDLTRPILVYGVNS